MLNKTGVSENLLQDTVPWLFWNEYTSDGDYLGGAGSTLPGEWIEKYGWPGIGVSRTKIQLALRDLALEKGIEYHQGWRLKAIQQDLDRVIATSEDGRKIEASFLVGCDGLKSFTREHVLLSHGIENKDPNFTGIAVVSNHYPSRILLTMLGWW